MPPTDVTLLLDAIRSGDESAYERLVPLIHDELHGLARARMHSERDGHTLQPTALVNEAYIRLVSSDVRWQNRAHFFAAAAEAMRRVLVDYARQRQAQKRGGGLERITIERANLAGDGPDADLLALNDALEALEERDGRLARVVRLRYLAGLNIEQTAEVFEVSPATVKRDWTYARAWLYERMKD